MTSPSSRRAGVVQGPQHAATGPEPSSGVGPASHLDEPEPALRSYLGKWDILAGTMLRDDLARFTDIYRLLLRAARAEGIDRDRLPDFLDLEDGGGSWLRRPAHD